MRTLVERGFVERVSRPGDRKTYLRVASGVWGTLLVRQLGGVAAFRELAGRAVVLLNRAEPNARARAEEMAMFYRWWAAEAPGLIARWDAYRAEHLTAQKLRGGDARKTTAFSGLEYRPPSRASPVAL